MIFVSSKIPSQTAGKNERSPHGRAEKIVWLLDLPLLIDCGLSHEAISFLDSLQKTGDLKMRIYGMLSDAKANYDFAFQKGKITTGRLHVCGFKVYADGALGSRGACLLQPYSDKPGWSGFLLSSRQHFDSVAKIISDHGWQMCTHAMVTVATGRC
jgi:predicted amidohydrolase YtcJ